MQANNWRGPPTRQSRFVCHAPVRCSTAKFPKNLMQLHQQSPPLVFEDLLKSMWWIFSVRNRGHSIRSSRPRFQAFDKVFKSEAVTK